MIAATTIAMAAHGRPSDLALRDLQGRAMFIAAASTKNRPLGLRSID